eukprot:753457-Hanusia_phi.AAC.5
MIRLNRYGEQGLRDRKRVITRVTRANKSGGEALGCNVGSETFWSEERRRGEDMRREKGRGTESRRGAGGGGGGEARLAAAAGAFCSALCRRGERGRVNTSDPLVRLESGSPLVYPTKRGVISPTLHRCDLGGMRAYAAEVNSVEADLRSQAGDRGPGEWRGDEDGEGEEED